MKKEYDFSKGRRGAVLRVAPGKTRVTIRLDDDILDWFRQQVDANVPRSGAGRRFRLRQSVGQHDVQR